MCCMYGVANNLHFKEPARNLLTGIAKQQEKNLQGILLSPKWTVSSEQLVICVTCFVFFPFNMHLWCNLTLLLGPLSLWCKLQSGYRDIRALLTLSNQRWCWEGWGSSRHGLDFKLLSMRNLPLCLLILAVVSCCVTRTALTCHNMFWDGCSGAVLGV